MVPIGGAHEPRASTHPVGDLKAEDVLIEGCRLVEVRGGPRGVQELRHRDARMHGCDAAFHHPAVDLDVHAAGIDEAQPAPHVVDVDVTTLLEGDALVFQSDPDFLELSVGVDGVADPRYPWVRSLDETQPVVVEPA